jgi:hypothetical protein
VNTALSLRKYTMVFQQSNSLFNNAHIIVLILLFYEANVFIFVEIKTIHMKKLMIPAVALAMFMASCGGVESDARTFCDKIKEEIEIQKSGDTEKMAEFAKESEEWYQEVGMKYEKDTVAAKEFVKLIMPCMEEAKKAAMGGN